MTGPWTRDETSAVGQVFEFRLWALLTEQSRGQLHVFLPTVDRGIDALLHRLADGVYLPVQAKSRSSLQDGEVHIVILAEGLTDDDLLIVAGLVTEGGIGPTFLVAPVGEFKRLADPSTDQGKPIYSAEFGMRPRSDSRWLPWLVPSERLVERFGLPAAGAIEAPIEVRPDWRSHIGYLGEAEVTRRLAESGDLNLFRPFPDSETAEIAVLQLTTRRVLGLQVKTVEASQDRMRATVDVYRSSFRPAPTTFLVVVAWLRDEGRFHDECALIPSTEVLDFASDDGRGHISFDFTGGAINTVVDAYRRKLRDLPAEIEALLS